MCLSHGTALLQPVCFQRGLSEQPPAGLPALGLLPSTQQHVLGICHCYPPIASLMPYGVATEVVSQTPRALHDFTPTFYLSGLQIRSSPPFPGSICSSHHRLLLTPQLHPCPLPEMPSPCYVLVFSESPAPSTGRWENAV
jgi:hypothetical protein